MFYFILLSLTVFILIKYKHSFVWLLVFFISNPGGITETYLSKTSLGGISYIDIFFIVSFLVLIFGKYKIRLFFINKIALNIFIVLLLFSLYKILAWGLIIPNSNFNYFVRYCLIRERDSIFGFLFIIPIYLFALKDLKTFLSVIILLDILILFFSIFSIVFNLDFIQIRQLERYHNSDAIRYMLYSYGLFIILIPTSLVVYIGKLKIANKNLLLIGVVLAVLTIILSITKGLYITIIGSALAAIYLTIELLKLPIIKSFRRAIFLILVLFFTLSIVFPKYVSYSKRAIKDVFMLATEGETSEGETSRYWQIPAITFEIKKNPFFGTGQGFENLSKDYDVDQFDATDLPLLAHIMQYGIVGILIYLIYYYKVIKLIGLCYKKLKSLNRKRIVTEYKYELVLFIVSTSFFVGYFLKIFQIFIELTKGAERIQMSIFTGLLLACLERIRMKSISIEKVNYQNRTIKNTSDNTFK